MPGSEKEGGLTTLSKNQSPSGVLWLKILPSKITWTPRHISFRGVFFWGDPLVLRLSSFVLQLTEALGPGADLLGKSFRARVARISTDGRAPIRRSSKGNGHRTFPLLAPRSPGMPRTFFPSAGKGGVAERRCFMKGPGFKFVLWNFRESGNEPRGPLKGNHQLDSIVFLGSLHFSFPAVHQQLFEA